jgi:protein farnesyltransferase/geranylgeranyltransferase type-1 subunit alpha
VPRAPLATSRRWLCVQSLGEGALGEELAFTHGVMMENAKNYQLWNHRRLVALKVGRALAWGAQTSIMRGY